MVPELFATYLYLFLNRVRCKTKRGSHYIQYSHFVSLKCIRNDAYTRDFHFADRRDVERKNSCPNKELMFIKVSINIVC